MVYMGSKRRYCKYIVPIIQKYIDEYGIDCFVDCFCGGANLTDKIKCETVIANDLSPTLIALHKQAQEDFSKIPTDGNREYWDKAYSEWKRMRAAMINGEIPSDFIPEMPLYEIGAIEWYSSFANGGFPRGYAKNTAARNYYQEAWRNHQKQAESENYKKIIFVQGDYHHIEMLNDPEENKNILLYADSPYQGTKPYAIDNKFDFTAYYEWLKYISTIFPIFVSEQQLPKEFNEYIVWEKDDIKRTAGMDNNFKACEKLWLIDRRNK